MGVHGEGIKGRSEADPETRSAASVDSLGEVEQNHAALLAICSELEAFADDLPHGLHCDACEEIVNRLEERLSKAHEIEERLLFPLAEKAEEAERGGTADKAVNDVSPSLVRLRDEHLEDESCVMEIAEFVRLYRSGGENTPAVESLGYLLRGFFEGLRRHIAFENEVLIPLAKKGLSQKEA